MGTTICTQNMHAPLAKVMDPKSIMGIIHVFLQADEIFTLK
jgi:hypothetical protein